MYKPLIGISRINRPQAGGQHHYTKQKIFPPKILKKAQVKADQGSKRGTA